MGGLAVFLVGSRSTRKRVKGEMSCTKATDGVSHRWSGLVLKLGLGVLLNLVLSLRLKLHRTPKKWCQLQCCAYMSISGLVTHNLHDWFLSWCPFPSCPSVCLCLSMCVNCFHMVDRISSLGLLVMKSNWVESLSEEQIMLSYASRVLKTNTLPAARGWLMLVCQIFPVSAAGPYH